jgi:organic radical activating enzyme
MSCLVQLRSGHQPLPEPLRESVRINWHITSWCNYHCAYCPVMTFQRRSPSRGKQPHAFDYHSAGEWLSLLARFPERHIHLKITGGEPFLDRKNLHDLLQGLSRLEHFRVGIDTNGYWSPDYFRSVDKSRLFLNVSCHVSEVPFEEFVKRLLSIRDAGFRVAMVNFVLTPESLAAFETVYQRLEQEGFFVNVSTMNPAGLYESRLERTLRELELIERYNTPIDVLYKVARPVTKERPCFYPALSYYMLWDGMIQVSCTGRFQDAFTDGIPARPSGAVGCPYDQCLGCTDMYRSLADEPLAGGELQLFTLENLATETIAFRKRGLWRDDRRPVAPPRRPAASNAVIPMGAIRTAAPPEPIFGKVDIAAVDARSGDRIALSGWAASRDPNVRVERIRVLLDGGEIGVVRYFHSRPDVAATYGRPDLEQCGWRAKFFLPSLRSGEYALTARAVAADGTFADLASVPLRIIE